MARIRCDVPRPRSSTGPPAISAPCRCFLAIPRSRTRFEFWASMLRRTGDGGADDQRPTTGEAAQDDAGGSRSRFVNSNRTVSNSVNRHLQGQIRTMLMRPISAVRAVFQLSISGSALGFLANRRRTIWVRFRHTKNTFHATMFSIGTGWQKK